MERKKTATVGGDALKDPKQEKLSAKILYLKKEGPHRQGRRSEKDRRRWGAAIKRNGRGLFHGGAVVN